MKQIMCITLLCLTMSLPPATADEELNPYLCQGKYLTPEQGKAMLAERLTQTRTRADWEDYSQHLRECILKGMDLNPLPRRTPLNVISRNKRQHNGYTVENIAIETIPGYFAGCNLYCPTDLDGPVPVVLCPNGHWGDSRFNEQVQMRCATLARMGAIALSIGNFGWGSSPDQAVQRIHVRSFALTMQTWNNMRALDYLLSLDHADPQRVGVTGASGGGTQTLLLTALDDRITVSVPVAMVSSYMYGGCLCESGKPIHRSADHFTNNVEITAMAAPRPLLLVSDGGDWTANTPDVEYPFIKKIYSLYDAQSQVANAHFAEEGHDYGPNKRRAMYRFMAEQFGLDIKRIQNADEKIDETPVVVENMATLQVFNENNPFPANICKSLEEIETSFKRLQALAQLAIEVKGEATPRLKYASQQLRKNISRFGTARIILSSDKLNRVEGDRSPEGFHLYRDAEGTYHIEGYGDSGTLYGALALIDRVTESGQWPETLDITEVPAFRLRGPCIGMQLTSILPGRDTYEYPYTPENFPFFYDKDQWIEFLDFLVANRMNTLYLWNGHPFASLVKLEDYPYALEVSEEVYQRNVKMYRLLTEEADKRGIWVIQMFYNIFVSKPFAEHHHIETQHAAPTELIADYNRKSITQFMEMYPNVGLLVCLGEALKGQENQEAWMNEVVISAVKQAMDTLGKTEEPPIVVRAHSVSNVKQMVESSLKHYTNLYTMAKYNGESLTSYEPRGEWQQVHLDMSRLGSAHVVNVHLLSNLEPFRYGAQDYIRRCVLACRDRLGAQGVHLYPLAYWDWPNTPDKVNPPLKQYNRDWIWFEAWARYLWQPDRDLEQDHQYWIRRLTQMYGNAQAAEQILTAYNESGYCAPILLRRLGITEGNRQTLSLGMFLDQLVNPGPYGPFSGLWEWQAPPGERLEEYAKKEWAGQPHTGETPVTAIEESNRHAALAVQAIEQAAGLVTRHQDEFNRLRNDIHCIDLMSQFYAEKVRAAILVLDYSYSHKPESMHRAEIHLAQSLEYYRVLTEQTSKFYRYANTLQTGHRRIPIRGMKDNAPYYYHWEHMLGLYEKELEDFKVRVAHLEDSKLQHNRPGPRLKGVPFELLSEDCETYEVNIGAKPFTDRGYHILQMAEELEGLTGIRLSHTAGKNDTLKPLRLKTEVPVQILIGYFNENRPIWALPPNLDIDSQAAKYGGVESTIQNALQIEECPQINVHVFSFPAGEITFDPRSPGSYLFLGVIPAEMEVTSRDAGISPGRQVVYNR